MIMLTYEIPVIVKVHEEDDTRDENFLSHDGDVVGLAVDDFNSNDMIQYIGYNDVENSILINSMKAVVNHGMEVQVKYDISYFDFIEQPGFIEDIRKFLSGQCSDGWGEGFEQQQQHVEIDGEYRDIYISTWDKHNDVKFVSLMMLGG